MSYYATCEDCGCRIYDGYCTNCDEVVFIAQQYYSDGESCPQSLADEVAALTPRRTRAPQETRTKED